MKNGSNKTLNKNDTLINCLILAGVLVVVWKLVSSYFTKCNSNSNAVLTTSRTPPRVVRSIGRSSKRFLPRPGRFGPRGLGPKNYEHKQACQQQAKACKQQQKACKQQQRACERLR